MKHLLCFLFALASAFAPALAQDTFYLKDGDRVVFYGDSITDQRLYTTFVETYAVTRFPKHKTTFVHSGWGGDRVTGGSGGPIDTRLARDVHAYKPTVITIMLGMNDGQYRAFDEKIFNTYSTGYRHLVKSLKSSLPGARLTLIQPSPYDDVTRPPVFSGGYNSVLVRYGQFVKELAAQEHLQSSDLNAPVVAELQRARELDSEGAPKLVADRVHPGAGGHLLMAKALLKTWNAPALVSAVEIDAVAGKAVRAQNTEITELKASPQLTWTQADSALPMPLNLQDSAILLAIRASDVERSLNQQTLKVSGLPAAKYNLTIDDAPIGAYSKEQLEQGINLAMLATPMSRQAAEVHAFTLEHNHIHFTRWRQIQTPEAVAALDKLELELIQRQRAAAQPKPRRYKLIAQVSEPRP